MEQDRKNGVLNAAAQTYEQQLCILFNGQREGGVVEMLRTRVRASATLLVLPCKKHEDVLFFLKELCDADVLTESGEIGVRNCKLYCSLNVMVYFMAH